MTAVIWLVGTTLMFQGGPVASLQFDMAQGTAVSSVAGKQMSCAGGGKSITRCVLAGPNNTPLPNGPIGQVMNPAGASLLNLVASDPAGSGVSLVNLTPPQSLQATGK